MLPSTVLASIFITSVAAHSWIEQMQLITTNGSYAGDAGYPRGYIARTDPGFNGYSDKWQLPSPDYDLGRTRINETDFLCHPAQRSANYTTQYPKLKVTPDSFVALRYLENGHVTQPWIPSGKPADSGTVFIYGTYTPSADEKITDVLRWTSDGSGGNGKGFLMTAQDFDDGRCHQSNQSPVSIHRQMEFTDGAPSQESWCETDLHIPADGKTGSALTIYWIWSWQTSTQTEGAPCGKDEYYTTCADIDIVDKNQDLYSQPKVHTIVQQDPARSAPSNWQSRSAVMATPNLVTTEGCSITSVTYSSIPASETQMTSLPADFMQTFSKGQAQQQHTTVPISSAAPTGLSTAAVSSASPLAEQPPSAVNQNQVTVTIYNPPQTTVYVTAVPSSATTTAHMAAVVDHGQGMIGEKLEKIKIKARQHGRQFVDVLEK